MLSYVHGTGLEPLLGETIGENLRRTVEKFPGREALVVRGQNVRLTWQALWDETTRLARALITLGVAKGDRVGMWSPNRFEWVIAQYATARTGAILVNVNPAYRASELEYALRHSGTRFLLMAEGFRQTRYTELFADVRARTPVEQAFVLDADWDRLLALADDTPVDAVAAREQSLEFDEPINIQYTSGTTGAPKGATLSHHNILNNAANVARVLGYTENDRVCIPVPFYHCFGMVMGNLACSATGATMVIPSEAFDPAATLAAIEEEKCTSLYGVPTMFVAQLNHEDFGSTDFSALRTGIMAGSPCPIEIMKQVQTKMNMTEVTICYGMTETSPVSTQSRTDAPLERRVATVGEVHPHVEIKIVDAERGGVVPRGTQGELCTRGYSVMLGYWNDPAATAQAIDAAGWMHTGDLATMDPDGYIRITGRLKDMICRGGENIYPREVEEFLYSHPAIEEVQVIGVPSQKYVEEVMAWVKLKAGQGVSEEELVAYCKGKIASFKIPRYFKFVTEFPMTVTGKMQKYRMREIAVAELGLAELETA